MISKLFKLKKYTDYRYIDYRIKRYFCSNKPGELVGEIGSEPKQITGS